MSPWLRVASKMALTNQDLGCCCSSPTPTPTACVTAGCPPLATLTATLSDVTAAGVAAACSPSSSTTMGLIGGPTWITGTWSGGGILCDPVLNGPPVVFQVECDGLPSPHLQIFGFQGGIGPSQQFFNCGGANPACFASVTVTCSPFMIVITGVDPTATNYSTLTITP
jgi:hypothetical protein